MCVYCLRYEQGGAVGHGAVLCMQGPYLCYLIDAGWRRRMFALDWAHHCRASHNALAPAWCLLPLDLLPFTSCLHLLRSP